MCLFVNVEATRKFSRNAKEKSGHIKMYKVVKVNKTLNKLYPYYQNHMNFKIGVNKPNGSPTTATRRTSLAGSTRKLYGGCLHCCLTEEKAKAKIGLGVTNAVVIPVYVRKQDVIALGGQDMVGTMDVCVTQLVIKDKDYKKALESVVYK